MASSRKSAQSTRKTTSVKRNREQELEDQMTEVECELVNAGPEVSDKKKDEMARMLIQLAKAYKEEKAKNHENMFKDKAKDNALRKSQAVIEQLVQQRTLLERNNSKLDSKEVKKVMAVANAPISSPRGDKLLQKKYDNLEASILSYLNDIPGIDINEKKN